MVSIMKASVAIVLGCLCGGIGWWGGSSTANTATDPIATSATSESIKPPSRDSLLAPYLNDAAIAQKRIAQSFPQYTNSNIVDEEPFGKQMKAISTYLEKFYAADQVKPVALTMVCEQAARRVVVQFLNTHSYLGRDLREGKLKVSEVLSYSRKTFPIHHQAANETMAVKLFEQFSPFDFSTSIAFLEGVDAAAKEKAFLQQCNQLLANQGDAQRLHEILTNHPAGNGQLNGRFVGPWNIITKHAYERYADSYPEWLIALPQGADRDMALSQLAYQQQAEEPEFSKELLSHKAGGGK